MYFKIMYSSSMKSVIGNLMELHSIVDDLRLYGFFKQYQFQLPIHEHGISFNFFVSQISFLSVLQFQSMIFTSLVKFISRYFILYDVILNRIVFLLSLSDNSLIVYRKAMDFKLLILVPENLRIEFISSNSFWWTLQSFLYKKHIICKQHSLFLPSNLDDSFSFLIAISRTQIKC